jgi:hypothetical protein
MKMEPIHFQDKTKYQIRIKKDGMIEFLTPPPFAIGSIQHKTRWSEILPCNLELYIWFRILRFLFGERGKVAQWTRRWKCRWRMTVLETGYTETSDDRQALVDKEHELFFKPKGDWLN